MSRSIYSEEIEKDLIIKESKENREIIDNLLEEIQIRNKKLGKKEFSLNLKEKDILKREYEVRIDKKMQGYFIPKRAFNVLRVAPAKR